MKTQIDLSDLEKAGKERVKTLERLGEAVDQLASLLSAAYPDQQSVDLPRAFSDVTFQHWPSKEYCLRYCWFQDDQSRGWHSFTKSSKPTEALIFLAQYIEKGWLDTLIAQVRTETALFSRTTEALEAVLP